MLRVEMVSRALSKQKQLASRTAARRLSEWLQGAVARIIGKSLLGAPDSNLGPADEEARVLPELSMAIPTNAIQCALKGQKALPLPLSECCTCGRTCPTTKNQLIQMYSEDQAAGVKNISET
jgi:hypothetical protein